MVLNVNDKNELNKLVIVYHSKGICVYLNGIKIAGITPTNKITRIQRLYIDDNKLSKALLGRYVSTQLLYLKEN